MANIKQPSHRNKKQRHNQNNAKHDDNNKNQPSSKSATTSLSPSSLLVGAVLCVVVAASVAWLQQHRHQQPIYSTNDDVNTDADYSSNENTKKTSLSQLFRIACQDGLVHCNDYLLELHDHNRTIYSRDEHKSGSGLQKGWKILDIPRNVQIWTIDALRDPSIQGIMLRTSQTLSSRAYLALYLAVLAKRLRRQRPNRFWSPRERLLHSYLYHLPTYHDFETFHPMLLYNNNKPLSNSPFHFYVDHLILTLQQQIEHEFQAFCGSQQTITITNRQDTVQYITFREYMQARLQVHTRSFTAGPVSMQDVTPQELHVFGQHLTITLNHHDTIRHALGSAMVPLLDDFNHHAIHPTIGWKYIKEGPQDGSSNTSSFVVFAAANVPQGGTELFDTYGMTTPDSRIYAQYGFANVDGSGRRAALFTPFHRINSFIGFKITEGQSDWQQHTEHQSVNLLRYLAYDDGYESCIAIRKSSDSPKTSEQEFKLMKMQILQKFANQQSKWVGSVPGPATSNQTDNNDEGLKEILSTCRLLALTHYDYDGNGMQALKLILQGVRDGSLEVSAFQMRPGSPSMEIRAWHWMGRLAKETLLQLNGLSSMLVEEDRPLSASTAGIAYVRTGEIDAVERIQRRAFQEVYERVKDYTGNESSEGVNQSSLLLREHPCTGGHNDHE